jgi:hypothetical protein
MPIDEQFYEELFSLFSTKGWNHVTEGIAAEYQRLNDASRIEDEKQLMYVKGQLAVLQNLMNFEEGARLSYDQIQAEKRDQDEESF